MQRLASIMLACVAATGVDLAAQCNRDVHPITFVNALGQPVPTFIENESTFAQYNDHGVYMALAPTFPSGIYYVQVNDVDHSEILSRDLLMDRTIVVTNVNGVIQMSRLSVTPGLKPFGLGLNGQGQSMPLSPLASPSSPTSPCRFKAWISDWYINSDNDPMGWIFGPRSGFNPDTQACATASASFFRIGNGSPASVSGVVFLDSDRDGVRDNGEPGVPGMSVRLVGPNYENTLSTDANGQYSFTNVPGGEFTVYLLGNGFQATTPTSHPVPVCGCSPAGAPGFGIAPTCLECNGRTPGFWSNPNGRRIIENEHLLWELGLLMVVNEQGCRFTTCDYATFRRWLLGSNATNMAYKLSSHVVAMYFNVRAGLVDTHCVVHDPQLGDVAIADLLRRAVVSLTLYPQTLVGHPQRVNQELLKNALDRANNNQTWQH